MFHSLESCLTGTVKTSLLEVRDTLNYVLITLVPVHYLYGSIKKTMVFVTTQLPWSTSSREH